MCTGCEDSGRCAGCKGAGKRVRVVGFLRVKREVVPCRVCLGSGVCRMCGAGADRRREAALGAAGSHRPPR